MTLRLRLSFNVDDIGNLCLCAFLFLTSFIFLYRYDHAMFLLRYVFLLVGAAIGYGKCILAGRKFYKPVFFAAALALCWLLTSFGQVGYRNYPPSDLLYTICYIGISVLVLENRYGHAVSLGLLAFASCTILFRILRHVSMNAILTANSRNFLSILSLSVILLYYLSCHDKKKPVLVAPVLLYFYISVYATGRGGILVSGFLTVALLTYKYVGSENKPLKLLLACAIAIALVTAVVYAAGFDRMMAQRYLRLYFSRFYLKGSTDAARAGIWSDFFHNNAESVGAFLFGSDVRLPRSDGNLHNSFIQSYAAFGALGFVLIVSSAVKALWDGIRKKDYLWLILFTALMLRAFTDRVFFQGYCELYLYYFLFYDSYHRKRGYREGDICGYREGDIYG